MALAAAAVVGWVLREAQRRRLVAHVAAEGEGTTGGVDVLAFEDITCVLQRPAGCVGRRRGASENNIDNGGGGGGGGGGGAYCSVGRGGRVLLSHVSGRAAH